MGTIRELREAVFPFFEMDGSTWDLDFTADVIRDLEPTFGDIRQFLDRDGFVDYLTANDEAVITLVGAAVREQIFERGYDWPTFRVKLLEYIAEHTHAEFITLLVEAIARIAEPRTVFGREFVKLHRERR